MALSPNQVLFPLTETTPVQHQAPHESTEWLKLFNAFIDPTCGGDINQ
jgi:hypothetical protein